MKKSVPPLQPERFAVGVLSLLAQDPGDDPDSAGREALAVIAGTLFEDDARLQAAFRARFVALVGAFDRAEVQAWVRAGRPGVMHLHPALLTAAATARVNRNGRFALDRLAERIRVLADGEFADWQWPEPGDPPA